MARTQGLNLQNQWAKEEFLKESQSNTKNTDYPDIPGTYEEGELVFFITDYLGILTEEFGKVLKADPNHHLVELIGTPYGGHLLVETRMLRKAGTA